MNKPRYLTDEQRREIYEARMLGEKCKDVAEAYGVTTRTVANVVRKQRELLEKEDELGHKERVVGGNRRNGRLVSLADPKRYEGSCVVNGKVHTWRFTADNVDAANVIYDEWCDELRSKHSAPKSEPAAPTTPAPAKPVEKEGIVAEPVKQAEVKPMGDSVYVIWTKGDSPRLFGAYLNMESALKEVDNLNEIAAFLVNDRVFEVEELRLNS